MAPTKPETENADASPDHRTRVDFERAQQQVFEQAGIDVRSRFVEIKTPRVRLHVVEAGEMDERPPVLFVHGVTGFGAMFAPLMAELDATRMIAIDRPGWGLSGDFKYTPETHRQTAVNILVGVLDEIEIEQVDVVGHSTGGYWGIVLALAHPERVRRLIPIGGVPTFPGTRPPVPIRVITLPAINRVISRLQTPTEDGVVKQMGIVGESETVRQYPAIIRAKVSQDRNPRTAAVANSEFRSLLSLRGWRGISRLRETEIREIRQAPLFIWGENDFLGHPDDVRRSIESIPNARLESVASGHIPWFGHPADCAKFIREYRD